MRSLIIYGAYFFSVSALLIMLWLYYDYIKCHYFNKCKLKLEQLPPANTNELTINNKKLLDNVAKYIHHVQTNGSDRFFRRQLKKMLF
jgi:hypothetical protein